MNNSEQHGEGDAQTDYTPSLVVESWIHNGIRFRRIITRDGRTAIEWVENMRWAPFNVHG